MTHHEQMMIIGGAIACAFAFLRGLRGVLIAAPMRSGLITSSKGMAAPGVRASRAPCIAGRGGSGERTKRGLAGALIDLDQKALVLGSRKAR
jgi:hypothetical protein